MNIIKRLRRRETTNIKQQFAHTATTLESIIGHPDIVVPIREAVQPTTTTRLLKETEYFFRLHELPLIFCCKKLKIFHIKSDNFKNNSRYMLIYDYKGDKNKLAFNSAQKSDFMTDVLLQVGTKCQ